ncbi:MAG: manganese transporter [Rhodospirillales bacterium]|nr:MAG: manganese transporter [Rhodospirillales bacterium]
MRKERTQTLLKTRRTALLSAATLAICLSGGALAADPPLRVLATVGMIADVAETVAGDCAEVTTLIAPGVDPHYYSATPSDVRALSQAELILYVDFALEEQLAEVLRALSGRTRTLGVLEAALAADRLLDDPEAPGATDPHAWMDVSRWAEIVPVITAAMSEQRPDCAPAMEARAAAYRAQLDALHDWVGEAIASIPEGNRILVTAHDAFYYFSDAYGIQASEAIQGISTAAEASIGDILEVAEFVIENNVPAVFVETTVSPRTIRALVTEVRARGHRLEIGGELFSDAMGDTGTPEGTYIGMVRANTITITDALGGTRPPWPAVLGDWAAVWSLAD